MTDIKKVDQLVYVDGRLVAMLDDKTEVDVSLGTGPALPPDLTSVLSRLDAVEALNLVQQAQIDSIMDGGGTAPDGSPGTFVEFPAGLEWWQTNSVPGPNSPNGGRVQLQYKDAKVVTQGYYQPGGLSWLEHLVVLTGPCIDTIPDIDLALGGEWEFKLPWGHRLARANEPSLRGYFTFPVGLYYADHPRTMGGVGLIRTEAPNLCYASIRVDMYPQLLASEVHGDQLIGEEKGVLNRRRPWGKWTPGSWLRFTVIYPTE